MYRHDGEFIVEPMIPVRGGPMPYLPWSSGSLAQNLKAGIESMSTTIFMYMKYA